MNIGLPYYRSSYAAVLHNFNPSPIFGGVGVSYPGFMQITARGWDVSWRGKTARMSIWDYGVCIHAFLPSHSFITIWICPIYFGKYLHRQSCMVWKKWSLDFNAISTHAVVQAYRNIHHFFATVLQQANVYKHAMVKLRNILNQHFVLCHFRHLELLEEIWPLRDNMKVWPHIHIYVVT